MGLKPASKTGPDPYKAILCASGRDIRDIPTRDWRVGRQSAFAILFGVFAGAGITGICSSVAIEVVVALESTDQIIAGASLEIVVVRTPQQLVCAVSADDVVVSRIPVEVVVSGPTAHPIVAGPAGKPVVSWTTFNEVIAVPSSKDRIVSSASQ